MKPLFYEMVYIVIGAIIGFAIIYALTLWLFPVTPPCGCAGVNLTAHNAGVKP